MAGVQHLLEPEKNGSTFVFIKVYTLKNIGKSAGLGNVERDS